MPYDFDPTDPSFWTEAPDEKLPSAGDMYGILYDMKAACETLEARLNGRPIESLELVPEFEEESDEPKGKLIKLDPKLFDPPVGFN